MRSRLIETLIVVGILSMGSNGCDVGRGEAIPSPTSRGQSSNDAANMRWSSPMVSSSRSSVAAGACSNTKGAVSPCAANYECASGWCKAGACSNTKGAVSPCAANYECASGWCKA